MYIKIKDLQFRYMQQYGNNKYIWIEVDRQLERKRDDFSAEEQRLGLKCECIVQYTSDRQINIYLGRQIDRYIYIWGRQIDINLRPSVDRWKINLSGQMDRFEYTDGQI